MFQDELVEISMKLFCVRGLVGEKENCSGWVRLGNVKCTFEGK